MHITRNILYLEDNEDDGLLMQAMLDEASDIRFEVTVCDSVDSAMLALSLQRYDAVFCDYVLVDEHGYRDTAERFVEQVLDHFPLLPLIVTSGMSRAALDSRLESRINSGSVGFLHKSAWQTSTLKGAMASVQRRIEAIRSMPSHQASNEPGSSGHPQNPASGR